MDEFLRLNNTVAEGNSSSEVCHNKIQCACINCYNFFNKQTFQLKYGINDVQTDIREYLQVRMDSESDSSTGLVDNHSQFNQLKRRRGPEGSSYTTMAQFLKSDVEGYNILAEEVEKIGRPFFDYFTGKTVNHTGRYISDVFLFRGRRELAKSLEILRTYGGSRRNGMFGYSVESDHIHIIHDCTYSGRNCRCTFKEKIEPFGEFGPDRKYNKPIHQFTRTDWYDVFIYFFLAKRGTRDLWFRGKGWEIPPNCKLIFISSFSCTK